MMRNGTQRISLGALVLLLSFTASLWSQVFDLVNDRKPVTSLAGKWRFQPGDNPGWAAPAFDDSGWPLLRSDEGWTRQGYPQLSGLAWYRFQVVVPPNASAFLIDLPYIESTYQLFADGRLIAQTGNMPPHAQRIVGAKRLFTVPVRPLPQRQSVTVALRIWRESHLAASEAAGPHAAAYAGSPPAMLAFFETERHAQLFRAGSQYTVFVIEVLAGLASLLLYLLRRKETMYLWFALTCLIPPYSMPWFVLAHEGAPLVWGAALVGFLIFAGSITGALFYLSFAKMSVRPWMYVLTPASLAIFIGFFLYMGIRPRPAFMFLDWSGGTVYSIAVIALMGQAWRLRRPDAGWLFWPVLFNTLLTWLSYTDALLHAFGKGVFAAFDFSDLVLFSEPFVITLDDITNLIWYIGISAVLVYRFARISREEERLTVSLDAARDVQHRLVPASLPALPAFHAEAAYMSAEEVGGDFYQVLPQAEDELLVIIGDVSGKGLQAAMLGTLAVGAIRSLAQEEIEPAKLLSRLNDQLVAATDTSFVTCLCARISREGELTVANAGHLSPYVNGEELPCPSDLPLGIVAGIVYEQRRTVLKPRARVTFISDGVTEARNKAGELFGFDRALHSSRMTAAEIADTARHFGQEDDITVLTLDWRGTAAPVPASGRAARELIPDDVPGQHPAVL